MQIAGADVLECELHFPERGPWYALARLDTPIAPTGAVSVVAGFTLAGAVVVAGVFLDAAHVRLVGGAGGLSKLVTPAAYENAQQRDPLGALLSAVGEQESGAIDSELLGAALSFWTVRAAPAVVELNELCAAATQALGQPVTWRVLEDGSVWLGVETWPAAALPAGADVLEFFPDERRYVIGCETPFLLPGVALAGVGNVVAVDHWVQPGSVRTWAWVE